MNSKKQKTLTRVCVLAGLGMWFGAGLLSAPPVYQGRFSLPFETRWGTAVLPAGDYSFSLDSSSGEGVLKVRKDSRTVALLWALNIDEHASPGPSQLVVVREGNEATVHILHAAELGMEFHYKVPMRYEVYSRLIARASEPVIIERIPVSVSGK